MTLFSALQHRHDVAQRKWAWQEIIFNKHDEFRVDSAVPGQLDHIQGLFDNLWSRYLRIRLLELLVHGLTAAK